MSDFLQTMASHSAARAAAVSSTFSSSFSSQDFDKPLLPLTLGAFDVIAEIKDRSPAEGDLSAGSGDRSASAKADSAGGAAAISV